MKRPQQQQPPEEAQPAPQAPWEAVPDEVWRAILAAQELDFFVRPVCRRWEAAGRAVAEAKAYHWLTTMIPSPVSTAWEEDYAEMNEPVLRAARRALSGNLDRRGEEAQKYSDRGDEVELAQYIRHTPSSVEFACDLYRLVALHRHSRRSAAFAVPVDFYRQCRALTHVTHTVPSAYQAWKYGRMEHAGEKISSALILLRLAGETHYTLLAYDHFRPHLTHALGKKISRSTAAQSCSFDTQRIGSLQALDVVPLTCMAEPAVLCARQPATLVREPRTALYFLFSPLAPSRALAYLNTVPALHWAELSACTALARHLLQFKREVCGGTADVVPI